METFAIFVARYSIEMLVVVAAAAIVDRAVRLPARVRLGCWRAVVLACLLLPLVPARTITVPVPRTAGVSAEMLASVQPAAQAPGPRPLALLAWLILAGIVVRSAWLALGFVRLHRLRGRSMKGAVGEELLDLKRRIAPSADLRWHDDVGQPVTFGIRRPIVLLPRRLRDLAADVQRAVVCHELLHAARRDWPWVIAEEIVRTAFWFHPAIWWALAQVELAREQTVDAMSIALTGSRRRYVEALLAFADQPVLAPAPPLARRRHLLLRINALTEEIHMSRHRLFAGIVAVACAVVGGAASAAVAVPLRTFVRYHAANVAPSAPADVAPPIIVALAARRSAAASPAQSAKPQLQVVSQTKATYPPEALPYGVEAALLVEATIGTDGHVVKAHTVKWRLAFEHEIDDPDYWTSHPERPFADAAEAAAERWAFAPPGTTVTCDIEFTFRMRKDGEPMPTMPPASVGVKILEGGTRTAPKRQDRE